MSEYLKFINKMGLYCEIIGLESTIAYYQGACANPGNKDCFINLKNSLDSYLKELEQLLKSNNYLDREELKKEILDKWSDISEILLKEENYDERNQYNKVIYGMVLELVKEDLDFSSIYLFLVEHGLYNPNTACWISSEPFYTILPTNDINLFKEANKKVILDERTDFHILRNASDIFEHAWYCYKSATSELEKYYWHDYLLWTLDGNLSILDSKRFKAVNKKLSWDYKPIVYQIFANEQLTYLQDYLSTDAGILKQCQNTLYSSSTQLEAIDFYIRELEKRGIHNRHLLELKSKSS